MRRITLTAIAVALLTTGCGGAQGSFPPVRPEKLGQVIPGPAGAPDIECRAIAVERCARIGILPDDIRSQPMAEFSSAGTIERVIVSCEGAPCTPTDGAFRIDTVDTEGKTTEIGRGGYGNAVQPTAPPAPN